MKTKSIKLADIAIDPDMQVRVEINTSTVDDYAEAFIDGAKFPPCVVFYDGTQYLLADGFHRYMGAVEAQVKDLLCEVRPGSRAECLEFALSANATHGLPRTNADKQHAVEMALKNFSDRSDRVLAKMCAVSDKTVASVRKQHSAGAEVPHLTRIGADGKTYRLPTPAPVPAGGSEEERLERSTPPAPAGPVVDCIGHVIPAPALACWNRKPEIQEKLTRLSQIRTTLKAAYESKDVRFSECNFQSTLGGLEQVYVDIKRALPYCVCPQCRGMTPKGCDTCKGRGMVSEFFWTKIVRADTRAAIMREIKKDAAPSGKGESL